MADTLNDDAEVFRPQALGRLQTVDDLDAYIRVTSPSGWIVLAAAVAFLIGIIVWSNTASIPTTRTFSGLQDDVYVTAWVDEATLNSIKQGDTTATVAGIPAKDIIYDDIPMSDSEILDSLSLDYLKEAATTFDWNYIIVLELESAPRKRDAVNWMISTEDQGDDGGAGDGDAGEAEVEGAGDTEDGNAGDGEGADEDDEDYLESLRLVPVEVTTSETHPIRLVFESQ